VTAERFAAGEFPTLAGLLAFLRTVAINQRNNATRRIVRERRALDRWVQQEQLTGQADRSEQSVRRELADYVLSLVHDERERLVLHLTYEFDLPPREIVKRHPQYFENTAEVNRIKERLKKRLRSDLRLRRYLDET
jgi:DNA-directed RNA polymerase specialized sigma subunit